MIYRDLFNESKGQYHATSDHWRSLNELVRSLLNPFAILHGVGGNLIFSDGIYLHVILLHGHGALGYVDQDVDDGPHGGIILTTYFLRQHRTYFGAPENPAVLTNAHSNSVVVEVTAFCF